MNAETPRRREKREEENLRPLFCSAFLRVLASRRSSIFPMVGRHLFSLRRGRIEPKNLLEGGRPRPPIRVRGGGRGRPPSREFPSSLHHLLGNTKISPRRSCVNQQNTASRFAMGFSAAGALAGGFVGSSRATADEGVGGTKQDRLFRLVMNLHRLA